jgi:tetrahydrodipicolinate N-succinyltransferase
MPGQKIYYNKEVVKAIELSNKDGLTFRRNSLHGAIEALDKPNEVELNEDLHAA